MKKILFGTPLAKELVHVEHASSLVYGLQHLQNAGYKYRYASVAYADVATNRNILCAEAISYGADYLIFCDDDMSFDPDDLLAMVEADKDCIASLCVSRKISPDAQVATNGPINLPLGYVLGKFVTAVFTPLNEKYEPLTQRGQIIEVARIGTGLMAIKVEMLRALMAKEAVRKYTTLNGKDIHNFFWFNYSGDGRPLGEDLNFCKLVRENGYGIYMYVTDRTKHYGDYGYHFVF